MWLRLLPLSTRRLVRRSCKPERVAMTGRSLKVCLTIGSTETPAKTRTTSRLPTCSLAGDGGVVLMSVDLVEMLAAKTAEVKTERAKESSMFDDDDAGEVPAPDPQVLVDRHVGLAVKGLRDVLVGHAEMVVAARREVA